MTDFLDDLPEGIEEQLAGAAQLMEEERLEEALDLLTTLERDHPENPALLCMLGVATAEAEARSAMTAPLIGMNSASHTAGPPLAAKIGFGKGSWNRSHAMVKNAGVTINAERSPPNTNDAETRKAVVDTRM